MNAKRRCLNFLLLAFVPVALLMLFAWLSDASPRPKSLQLKIECLLEDLGLIEPDPFRHLNG